jgi:hypothetical protein
MIYPEITEDDREKTYKSCKKITRICDICGKNDQIKVDSYLKCKKYRNLTKDLCRSCSMIEYRKNNPMPIGNSHGRWSGGINKGYKLLSIKDDTTGHIKHVSEHRHIYSKFIGRDITSHESVHHIDMDKLNNNIENLYLYKSEKDHQNGHGSMELCAYKLFGEKIWFDREKIEYTIEPVQDYFSYDVINMPYRQNIITDKRTGYRYVMIYLKKEKKQKRLHVFICEQHLGRTLFRDECVHHIDGDTLNNDIHNLQNMSLRDHRLCHKSMQRCVAELFKQDFIGFNKENGTYFVV